MRADVFTIVMHKAVEAELFGNGGPRSKDAKGQGAVTISGKQVAIVLLIIVVMLCWIVDSMQLHLVPRGLHDGIAGSIDSLFNRLPSNGVTPEVDAIVAHNPLDDSPITFGSVVLLGVVCALGLLALGLGPARKQVH